MKIYWKKRRTQWNYDPNAESELQMDLLLTYKLRQLPVLAADSIQNEKWKL